MSVQDINELFQHIVQSEVKIKQRFEALRKVNLSIQDHKDRIKCTKYDTELLRGKMSTLNHKLIQEKIQKTWLESCKDILKDQLDECRKDKESLVKDIKEKRSSHQVTRREFMKKCDYLIKEYSDFCFGDQHGYKENWEEEYNALREEHVTVLKEISDHEAQRQRMDEMKKKLDDVKQEKENKMKQKEELNEELSTIKQDISCLETNKRTLKRKMTTDPEFRSVLQEIESGKDECNALTRKHQDLTRELHELQRRQRMQQDCQRNKQNSRSNAWNVSKRQENVARRPEPSRSSNNSNNRGKKIFRYNKTHSVNTGNSTYEKPRDVPRDVNPPPSSSSFCADTNLFDDDMSTFDDDIALLPDTIFATPNDNRVSDT